MTDTTNTTGAVYIAAGSRTPMGGLQGALADLTAVEVGAAAIKDAVKKANLTGEMKPLEVNVCTVGTGQLKFKKTNLPAFMICRPCVPRILALPHHRERFLAFQYAWFCLVFLRHSSTLSPPAFRIERWRVQL